MAFFNGSDFTESQSNNYTKYKKTTRNSSLEIRDFVAELQVDR